MLLNLKTTTTAAITAFALAASTAAPANAFGSNERKFLQGIAAAVIIGVVLNENKRSRDRQARAAAKPAPQPEPQAYFNHRRDGWQEPQHQPSRQHTRDDRYQEAPVARNQPQQGRVIGAGNSGYTPDYSSGLNQTPTARAFNSYSAAQRRAVQRRLAGFGYYAGAIDGAFGPRTHQALYEFASTAQKQSALDTTAGSYAVIDALLT